MEVDLLHNSTDTIETETVFCCVLRGSIFYSYYKPGAIVDIKDTLFIFEQYKKATQNGPLRVLVEMGPHSVLDKPSREFLQEHKVEAICEALPVTSLAQRLILNFYLRIKNHRNPSKVFKSRKSALELVYSFK